MMLYILFFIILVFIIYFILLYLSKKNKNFKKRKFDNEYYRQCFLNIFISTSFYIFVIHFKKIYTDINFPSISSIIIYLLTADTFYYWIHRIIHRTPFLKEHLHLTHHSAFDLVLIDLFYIDIKENLLYLFVTGLCPLLFIHVNMVEYLIVNLLIFYHALYTHSETKDKFILPLFIDSNYHKYHHQIGKGNYSVLFPIWDNYMGTRIKPHKKRKINKNLNKIINKKIIV